MKKILALLLAATMLLLFASCGETPSDNTTPSGTVRPVETTGASTPAETTGTPADETTGTTAETTGTPAETTGSVIIPEPPIPDTGAGRQWVSVGSYVTLVYNATTCDVTYEVKKGLGSRENLTFHVTMHDGYTFDGWSVGKALAEAPETSKVMTADFTYEATKDTRVYLNTSMTLTYDNNGGTTKGSFGGQQKYSLVFYENPNTLPDKGYFTRDGYTLTGYNTEADGTGEYVTLGGKLLTHLNGSTTLYCVWEKNTPESDFEFDSSVASATITGYKGEDKTVVIPETIGGKKVTRIAKDAFLDSDVTRVVVAKTVAIIEEYAFDNCKELQSVVLSDASISASSKNPGISKNSFVDCDKLSDICINTCYTLTNEWMATTGASKVDRLMWAKDKKKIILVGGSGTLMGFDGKTLYEGMHGEYEIVNLGENANVNSVMYFDLIEDFVKEGDIVLWCPEPGTYTLGQRRTGNRTYWDFRKSDYQFMRYLDYRLYDDIFETFSTYAGHLGSIDMKPSDLGSGSIDPYGCDASQRVWNKVIQPYNFKYKTGAEEELKGLFANIRAKGATIYFSFAAMQKGGMESIKEEDVLRFEKIITEQLGVTPISNYKDLILENDMFYDSAWHLSSKGIIVRSERVVTDLLAQLEKEGK